ncbi:tripartite tricarboxylate transporter substrate binding protein [Ottowia sp.]|jgi:tripartite-type tricarboxylate transporter receptor subunit TctC|uniref:Bug family tripartite tricarboxylate transporter substrate binding protein n=1 Tax=Ottowia sp. TaxID=1898956 RepID=UPI0025D5176D|nr:tripartite tricarboxylate transporter substrate binding protein [Ottowia sp.]MBK6614017.1 tripartite tricarboxylate transporter substrate binding protein [Ottowia sp.]MBK6745424.1 tripartite tricarboxylate transporter substrate binding protein [Ottowia sp.]
MKRLSFIKAVALAAAGVLYTQSGFAFSDKPVKLIVPAPAGGTADVFARIIGEQLAKEIQQPVVVDNKPGAGGAIAIKYMLSQPADGASLVVAASNVLTEVPHVLKGGFDPLKDVKPAAEMARSLMLFIAAPRFPAKDAKEAIAYVKAHPGTVSVASYSQGTSSQYAGAILNKKAGIDMQHVPFPGSSAALAQVMGNQIPLMFDGSVTAKPMIAAGKVRLLGVASKTRMPEYPNVPTMAEIGYPELNFSNWMGVIASAKTPRPLLEKIHAALEKVNASAAVLERYRGVGFEPVKERRTLDQSEADVRAEFDRNAQIVKAYGIKLD